MNRTRSTVCLALLATAAPAQHWLSAPADLPTGIEEVRLSGDLDLDGDTDFLAVFHGSFIGYMTPWTNDGAGRFSAGTRIELPASTATRVALGDVTGDGRPDFVSSTTNGSSLGAGLLVYPGQPGATFGAPLSTPLPGNVVGLAVGNADGSGPQDLAVLHFDTGIAVNLSWLIATGTGGFVRLPGTEVGGLIDDLVCVDLDADGRDDAALSHGDSVSLYRGHDAPALLAALPIPALLGRFPSSYLDVGDLDGDGDQDLAVGSHGLDGDALSVVCNEGAASWSIRSALTWTGGSTYQPLVGDWDRDGLGDVVAWTFFPAVQFFRNTGGGAFQAVRAIHDIDDGWIQHASLEDFDRDGCLDLQLPRHVLFGDGTFGDPDGGAGRATSLFDWEGDGDLDLLTTTADVMLNDGRGVFGSTLSFPQPEAPPDTFYALDMLVGDFDQDGNTEYLASLFDDAPYPFLPTFREMRWLVPTTAGVLVDVGLAAPAGLQIPRGLTTDIDRDGDLDVLSREGLFLNTDGSWSAPVPAFGIWVPVTAGDIDDDGDLDVLAVSVFGSQNVALLRQGPALAFEVEELLTSPSTVIRNNRPLLADLDDDGDLDVAADPAPGAQTIALFENQDGAFAEVAGSGLGPAARALFAVDVDVDGRTDLVAADTTTVVYRRVGPGLRYETGTSFQARLGGPQTAADIDHDGDVDLVIGGIVRNRAFFGPDTGGSRQYGVGTAGSGGHVPVLGARGVFRPGESAGLRLRRGLGRTLGLLVVGLTGTDGSVAIPGLSIYLDDPVLAWFFLAEGAPWQPGAGTADLTLDPFLGALSGLTFYHQMALFDPAVPNGFTLTNGLEVRYGR